MNEPEDNFSEFWAEVEKNWPPRLLDTFGHAQTEQAAEKFLDNCDENGYVNEEVFPKGCGLYDLGCNLVTKVNGKWKAKPEFYQIIKEKHPEEVKNFPKNYE